MQKNAYWIGMGDYADCILKDDKRFDIGGLAPWVKADNILETQRKWLNDLFSPIASKCIAFLTGNHEEKVHKTYQVDFTRNLSEDLKIPYAGYHCFINLGFNRHTPSGNDTYIIHAWHGAGSAQTEGARLMRLMRLVNDIQADIYLMGHLHAMTQHTPDRLIYFRGKVKSVKLAALITGSWLKAYTQPKEGETMTPSYAEVAGYKPSRLGCPCIVLYPDAKSFWVES